MKMNISEYILNTLPAVSVALIVVVICYCPTNARAQGSQSFQGIKLYDPASPSNKVTLLPPSGLGSSYSLTLPTSQGAASALLLNDGTGSLSWVTLGSLISGTGWSVTGNALTNPLINYLGTTDAQPLLIKTNSTERIRILSSGEVGIGTSTPGQKLELKNGNLLLSNSGTAGELRLAEPSGGGSEYTSFKAQSQTANITYTLPSTAPTAGQFLSSDGSGTMSWTSIASITNGSVANSTLSWNGSSWIENTNAQTLAGALTLGSNSNVGSVVLNDGQATSKTATISIANQAVNRIYTVPDAGNNANFVMTEGAQTLNGAKTFGSTPTISPFTSAGIVKNNASGVLSSGQASLTTDVSGILPVANGGTGVATLTGFPSGNGTAAMTARTMTGTTNQISVSNGDGVGGNPTFAIANDVILPGTGAVTVPIGTSVQQPSTPVNGMMRYNSTSNRFEFYQNGVWSTYATGGAAIAAGTATSSTLRWNGSMWVENTNAQTNSGALTLGSNSNAGSVVLNDGQPISKTTTISIANQTVNRTYTIPDAGNNANFVLTEGAQTVNGVKTFGSAPTISPFTSAGLVKNNASGVLSSGQASLTTDVSGVLPVANGGTGLSTITGFPSGNGSTAMTARTMTGTTNQISVSNGDGVSGNPTFAICNDAILPGTGGTTLQSGTTAQRPGSPANGLMRYNSTINQFEFYQNGSWTSYATATGTWSTTGNSATSPGTNFIGTSDAQTLVFKTNGTEAIRINTSQMVGIGTTLPTTGSTLDVKGHVALSNNGTASELRLYEPSGSGTNYSSFKSQAQAADVSYTLPASQGTSNSVLINDGSGNLSWQTGGQKFAYKSADETRTSTTSVSDDADLFTSIGANEVWEFTWYLRVTGAPGGVKVAITIPSGTLDAHLMMNNNNSNDEYEFINTSGTTSSVDYEVVDAGTLLEIHALVFTGGTPGNVRLRWSQFSSSGTATRIKQNSWMKAVKMQ